MSLEKFKNLTFEYLVGLRKKVGKVIDEKYGGSWEHITDVECKELAYSRGVRSIIWNSGRFRTMGKMEAKMKSQGKYYDSVEAELVFETRLSDDCLGNEVWIPCELQDIINLVKLQGHWKELEDLREIVEILNLIKDFFEIADNLQNQANEFVKEVSN